MKNVFLTGDKVKLGPLEQEDTVQLAHWYNDPEVRRTLRRYRPVTLAMQQEHLSRIESREDGLVLAVAVRSTDQLIGTIGLENLDYKNGHACLGLIIGVASAWGNGYGSEAVELLLEHTFRTLRLNRVWFQTLEFNQRALRACARLGFKQEGRLRQDHFLDGRYWDTLLFGLLRDEWEKASKPARLQHQAVPSLPEGRGLVSELIPVGGHGPEPMTSA